jgi:tetratricopeptide (TPR) repeat protein
MADDEFNAYMRIAEEYMGRGRYYMAANAYRLASTFKPSDPLAYAGRGHALLASGEYLSAATFISKTIEMFPEYAGFDIDLVAMVSDKDALENRIIDLEKWVKNSGGAVELNFLLAYTYHQIGRDQKALEAIEAAYEKMPKNTSVVIQKQVIEASLKK